MDGGLALYYFISKWDGLHPLPEENRLPKSSAFAIAAGGEWRRAKLTCPFFLIKKGEKIKAVYRFPC